MITQNHNVLRAMEILQSILPQSVTITEASVIFLDIDDVLLEPPYQLIIRLCQENGLKAPSPDQIINRPDVDWFKTLPDLLPNKAAYARTMMKGFWQGGCFTQSLFKEHDFYSLREVLKSDRIILLTRFPKLFGPQRKQFLEQFFRIDFTGRFIATGGLLSKGKTKGEVIEDILKTAGFEMCSAVMVDDNPAELASARSRGIETICVSRPWNQEFPGDRIPLEDLVGTLESLLLPKSEK